MRNENLMNDQPGKKRVSKICPTHAHFPVEIGAKASLTPGVNLNLWILRIVHVPPIKLSQFFCIGEPLQDDETNKKQLQRK